MHRVLIGHNSELYARSVARKLGSGFDVRICQDGAEIGSILDSYQPDILLLSSAMPRKDALTILAERPVLPPVTIIIANYVGTEQEWILRSMGVRRILLMPTCDEVLTTLQDLLTQTELENNDTEVYRVRHFLLALNFDTHLDGFRLICSAVPMVRRNPHQTLSKHIYPAIAKAHHLTDQRAVEHSIRNSIEKAWRHRCDAVWARFFSPNATGQIPCPSNSKMLNTLAQWISIKD